MATRIDPAKRDQMISDLKRVNSLQKVNEADYGSYVKRWFVDADGYSWIEIYQKDGSEHTLMVQ